MSLTKIKGSQIRDLTLKNIHIANDAKIDITKLSKLVITADGRNVFTADQSMGNFRIKDLAPGTDPGDAINLSQLQQLLSGLSWKSSVKVATTSNISLFGLQIIDDIQLNPSDRVLVKNQLNSADNGIYNVTSNAWIRSNDTNTASKLVGASVWVVSGSTYGDSGWTQNSEVAILGTSEVLWVQFNGSSSVSPLS